MINDIIDACHYEALFEVFGQSSIITELSGNTTLYESAEKSFIPVPITKDVPTDYLVPDSSKRLIVWFEASIVNTSEINNDLRGAFDLSLYAWGNKSLFSGTSEAQLIIYFNQLIQRAKKEVTPSIYGIRSILKSVKTQKSDFSKYTAFSKKQEVFLHPYFYFKMDFSVTFVTSCIAPITPIQNECC